MRFQPPDRSAVAAECWSRPPLFEWVRGFPWLATGDWPSIEQLNRLLAGYRHGVTGQELAFTAQNARLLADGLHYEQRTFAHGAISTRESNWHDLFNALIWVRHGGLKSALNARYVAEMDQTGGGDRNRAQMALTHFDEAGAIVWIDSESGLAAWDRHDWSGLFLTEQLAWQNGSISISVVGHALLEHALRPHQLTVAKCLLVAARKPTSETAVREAERLLAEAIVSSRLLNDPQDLRPLPLAGIDGWFPGNREAAFFASAECFRPLRRGRCYPPPWRWDTTAASSGLD